VKGDFGSFSIASLAGFSYSPDFQIAQRVAVHSIVDATVSLRKCAKEKTEKRARVRTIDKFLSSAEN
jgi:hypothetical protein